MTQKYKKYNHINITLPDFINDLVRRECFLMRISRQEFIRAIIRSHLSKKYGADVFLENEEIREKIKKQNL